MNPLLHKNFTAGGAIAPYRIVTFSAADTVIQAAAATNPLIGVNDDVAPVSGERTDIIMAGIALIEAGAAFALTARITSDATGRAVAAAPSAGANVNCIGYPMEPAVAAGDLIRVLIAPHSFQG
jgi:hypothetical protein